MMKNKMVCSICEEELPPNGVVDERRPTAVDFALESWDYCVECWFHIEQLRLSTRSLDSSLDKALEAKEACSPTSTWNQEHSRMFPATG